MPLQDLKSQKVLIITNLKQTNTKLMYDSIRRNPKPKKENIEQEQLENAERTAQEIDIYD